MDVSEIYVLIWIANILPSKLENIKNEELFLFFSRESIAEFNQSKLSQPCQPWPEI